MIRQLLLGLLTSIALWGAPAHAQNICPTAPPGTNNNQCASTAFVQDAITSGTSLVVGSSPITGGTSTRILYDNAGILGEYTLTGTGNVVAMQTSPSFVTPALGAATATSVAIAGCTIGTDELCVTGQTNLGGTTTIGGALTYGGVTLSNSVTGTGSMVLGTSPTIASPTFSGTVAGNNTIPLTILAQSAANTILGNWTGSAGNVAANAMPSCPDTAGNHLNYVSGTGIICGTSGSAASLVVGTTSITSGTTTRILYDNAGTLGEYAISGSGSVAMTTSPSFTTPSLGVATATSINKVAFTAPASSATLTIADGKTATFSNSITFAGTDSTTMTFPSTSSTIPMKVASGAKALATGAISSATCTSAQTDTATGTLTTDVVNASFNGDPTAVTGYVPLTSGMLTIIAYPTADTVNFKVCNNTGSSITPGAITLNWQVIR